MGTVFADSLTHGAPGPATAIEYATGGFLSWCVSLLLMIVFLSLIMEGVRYATTTAKQMVVPKSTDNSKVWVLKSWLPAGFYTGIQTLLIIGVIIAIRGAFGAITFVNYPFDQQEYLAMVEATAAFGFLALAYRVFGPMLAKKFTYSIIKSKLQKSEKIGGGEIEIDGDKIPSIITQEEYMALGVTHPEPNPPTDVKPGE